MALAVEGMDAVIHLAAIIPPGSDEDPTRARAVNVDGTANVVKAAQGRSRKPRVLFISTFDVHGRTQSRPPPRKVTDPVVATDVYTESKIAAEALVRESGLEWCIFRLVDVPILGLRDPHPIMFEIGLDNRIESIHADDAATAIARGLRTPEVWGRTLFIGGGKSCQLTYREFLTRMLGAMGMEMLPEEAFTDAEYATDWVDSDRVAGAPAVPAPDLRRHHRGHREVPGLEEGLRAHGELDGEEEDARDVALLAAAPAVGNRPGAAARMPGATPRRRCGGPRPRPRCADARRGGPAGSWAGAPRGPTGWRRRAGWSRRPG